VDMVWIHIHRLVNAQVIWDLLALVRVVHMN
jgi:hypothetical protein